MWNAECGMSVEASPRASTSHFNSASRTPHSALSPHQRHRYIANYLERRGTHLVDRVFRRVPVRVVEVHDVDRVDARFLQGDVIVGQRLLHAGDEDAPVAQVGGDPPHPDRKSTRLNSSHGYISYAVFCLKKKKKKKPHPRLPPPSPSPTESHPCNTR